MGREVKNIMSGKDRNSGTGNGSAQTAAFKQIDAMRQRTMYEDAIRNVEEEYQRHLAAMDLQTMTPDKLESQLNDIDEKRKNKLKLLYERLEALNKEVDQGLHSVLPGQP